MDRTEFLQICQKCWVYTEGFTKLSKPIIPNLVVISCGIKYYPMKYVLGFDKKGNYTHEVILHDIKANAILTTYLDKVYKYIKA